jgi:hypothetical protein
MKMQIILLAIAFTCSTPAAIFEFNFGTGGMNGANERPVPVLTTATGGELNFPGEPSISYDNGSHQLFLNFGWGSAQGYTDLQGSFTMSHIHGPADETAAAGILYNLTPLVSVDGQSGGVFQKVIQLVASPNGTTYDVPTQEAQLFAGDWYINVHSDFAPGGEIRGQLVPVPEPETYAFVGAVMLLLFAGIRKYRMAAA